MRYGHPNFYNMNAIRSQHLLKLWVPAGTDRYRPQVRRTSGVRRGIHGGAWNRNAPRRSDRGGSPPTGADWQSFKTAWHFPAPHNWLREGLLRPHWGHSWPHGYILSSIRAIYSGWSEWLATLNCQYCTFVCSFQCPHAICITRQKFFR